MTRKEAWKPIDYSVQQLDSAVMTRILDDLYGSKYQFLSDDALARLRDVNFYYDYYNLHAQYWKPTKGLGYDPTVMPVNLARWFTRRRASWMFEVAPDIECPPLVVDKLEDMASVDYQPSNRQKKMDRQASAREQILYSIWGDNQFDEKLIAGATDYYIGGTVALKLRYIPYVGIVLDFAPAQEVFPIPDPLQPDRYIGIHFCSYMDNTNTLWRQTWRMWRGKCYLTEGTYAASNLKPIKIPYADVDTGLDFIPVIVFPHRALSGDIFGESFLKDLIPLFDQFNRSMSDSADGLRFNMFAIKVLLNGPPDAEKVLKVAPNELWNIGGDNVDAKTLESGFQYDVALRDFLQRLEDLMHTLSDVPDVTPERIRGFGLVSGVALKLLYSDLVSATQEAWRIWKSRLQLANEYMLRMLETYENTEGFPYEFKVRDINGTYNSRIVPHLPLPENEAEKIAMEVNKLSNSLQSVKGALTELGEKFPERKIAEMIAERESFLIEGGGVGKQLSKLEKETIGGL